MGCIASKENTLADELVPNKESQNEKLPEDIFRKQLLKQKPILSIELLPDEVIEEIMTYLSHSDLFNLSKEGERLESCAKRVLKQKRLSKFIIL